MNSFHLVLLLSIAALVSPCLARPDDGQMVIFIVLPIVFGVIFVSIIVIRCLCIYGIICGYLATNSTYEVAPVVVLHQEVNTPYTPLIQSPPPPVAYASAPVYYNAPPQYVQPGYVQYSN